MSGKPFVLPVKSRRGYYIYDINQNQIIRVEKELYDYIKDILDDKDNTGAVQSVKDQVSYLQECGYLMPSVIKEIRHPASDNAELLLERRIDMMILQVTQQCNLRCEYCVYSENKNLSQRAHSDNVMKWDVAKAAVDFLYAHSIESPDVTIGFYGGEPLLAFSLIKKVVAYADALFEGKNVTYAITTNATLISDDVAEFLNEHDFRLTFSLDGPRESHNKNRVFPNGSGTYDVVVENIAKWYNCYSNPGKVKYGSINSVISPNQEYNELKDMFSNSVINALAFQPTYVEENGETILPPPEFFEGYSYDSFLALFRFFRNLEASDNNKYGAQEVTSLVSDRRLFLSSSVGVVSAPSGPCIPGKLRLFVNCFGDMFPCERVNENDVMKIGSVFEGLNIDKIIELLNVSCVNKEKCKSCFAFSLCGICAKAADNGQCLDGHTKEKACEHSRNSAMNYIYEKVLQFENSQHLRDIARREQWHKHSL